MRVITGTARGRRLEAVPGLTVRPTTDRVKEAIFSILQFEIEGAEVLDLFAGSGQLGIEALSRGAASCAFVDSLPAARQVVHRNLEQTGLTAGAHFHAMDALTFLQGCRQRFHIALVDPPYAAGLLEKVLPLLAGCMHPNGVIVCESDERRSLPETLPGFALHKRYRYGKTVVTVYRGGQNNE